MVDGSDHPQLEPFDRLNGDLSLDRIGDQFREAMVQLPRINEKLKLMEAALNRAAEGGAEQEGVPDGSYSYIPIDACQFLDCLFDLETALSQDSDYTDPDLAHRRVDFVEAGCGPGRNVMLAQSTDRFEFRRVHGFDISPEVIDWGRKVFRLGDTIEVGDCNTFDFSEWDVVYFYRPFADPDKQTEFEDRLVKTLRTGAYVIGCGNLSLHDDRRLLCKDEVGQLYKKLR